MTKDKSVLRRLLIDHDSPQDIFKELFRLKKEQNSRFSIGTIARECGIPSRGYISEFMNGKRSLNEKYWDKMLLCFELKGRMADIVKVLLQINDLKEDDPGMPALRRRLEGLRRAIVNDTGTLPQKLKGLFFAFEVFCSFGLFDNKPTRDDLRKYFGREYALEVDYAITALLSLDLIAMDETGKHYEVKENAIRFNDSDDDGLSHLNYLRYAIRDADQQLSRWYRNDKSLFESAIISVKLKDYVPFLQRHYEELLVGLRELESTEADTLVRFNIQAYPVR